MIEHAWLVSLARLLKSLVQHLWGTTRVRDGSRVVLVGPGDTEEDRPEILVIGLGGGDQLSFLQLHLGVMNKGLAPARNLAISISLPKRLLADFPMRRSDPESSASFFRTDEDEFNVTLHFHLPTLRIDEAVAVPLSLRISRDDWITVKAGGHQVRQGDFFSVDYRAEVPLNLIALNVRMVALADNIRAADRSWEIWLTPAKSWNDLKTLSIILIAIQRIWKRSVGAFVLPILGSAVLMPRWRSRFQKVALIYLKSNELARLGEIGQLFRVKPGTEFLSGQYYRSVAANPSSIGEFLRWATRIRRERPAYYARGANAPHRRRRRE
jgi:hypothetical protein